MNETLEITKPTNREKLCWDYYVETFMEGKPNAYQSALKAGYSEDHARNITCQGWFRDKLSRLSRTEMFTNAESVLNSVLLMKDEDENGKPNIPILRIKVNVAKHVTSTLGKGVGYNNSASVNFSFVNANNFSPETKENHFISTSPEALDLIEKLNEISYAERINKM